MQGKEEEDMEVGELDLDKIEQACLNLVEGFIPSQQVTLLRDAIIKVKKLKTLGVNLGQKKDQRESARMWVTNGADAVTNKESEMWGKTQSVGVIPDVRGGI